MYYKMTYRNGKNIREHRAIMQDFLGRELSANELVHHKDGDIRNNAVENLELTTRSEHARLHSVGRCVSEETRQKISSSNKGRILSPEHIAKLIRNHKGMTGQKQSDHFKKVMSDKLKGKPTGIINGAKRVEQYEKDGSYIKTWDCAKHAAISVGLTSGTCIGNCCSGKQKSAGGYIWKFAK